MSLLKAARTAQYPLMAEFTFNFDDTMVNRPATRRLRLVQPSVASMVFDVLRCRRTRT
jgi:hypothetical protein